MHFAVYPVAAGISFFLLSHPVPAQAPVAIVEEVDSKSAGVEFMDYLTVGRTIRLSPNERLVIGYMKSCWRETIVNGTVTVGSEQSEVRDGAVQRVKVRCDAGKKIATSKETSGSGAMVFRKLPGVPLPQQTIYALSPVFELKGASRLVIERIDRKEKSTDLGIQERQLLRGAFFDLAKNNVSLTAGGLYRAKAGRKEVIFKVDPSAEPGSATIIGRLVHLRPPG